jgi:hypothetical protein
MKANSIFIILFFLVSLACQAQKARGKSNAIPFKGSAVQAEEKRKADEQSRVMEERRIAEEKRMEEEKKAEELRLEEERKAEEIRKEEIRNKKEGRTYFFAYVAVLGAHRRANAKILCADHGCGTL